MADRQRSRFWLWYWLAISTGYAIAALGYAQHAADAANHQIRDLQIQVDKLNKYIEQHKQPSNQAGPHKRKAGAVLRIPH